MIAGIASVVAAIAPLVTPLGGWVSNIIDDFNPKLLVFADTWILEGNSATIRVQATPGRDSSPIAYFNITDFSGISNLTRLQGNVWQYTAPETNANRTLAFRVVVVDSKNWKSHSYDLLVREENDNSPSSYHSSR